MAQAASKPETDAFAFADRLRAAALDHGFDAMGIAAPVPYRAMDQHLAQFLSAGWHGTMGWLAATAERRRAPRALWPEVGSVIALGLNYAPGHDPLRLLAYPDRAIVSCYAQGRDYHDVVKRRLKALGRWLGAATGLPLKVFVDTAPVMEKPLAEAAGLGWQGKHSNLVSRQHGSWLFLGAIYTAAVLPPDKPHPGRCGTCRRCLDVCPTDAFPEPYRLDARRCLSYLTIEHKGPVPHQFRRAMANRIYGCDDCLAVCPWNKFAQAAHEAAFHCRAELAAPRLSDLLMLSDAEFRALFAGSPIKRIGRARFLRNVAIAAGNSGDTLLVGRLLELLHDPDSVLRGAVVWALAQLLTPRAFATLRDKHLTTETNAVVRAEWA